MKKNILFFLLLPMLMTGQIGINIPNPNAQLDVVSGSEGVLIPRVNLTAANVAAPITTPIDGELIFNMADVTIAPPNAHNSIVKGFYFWDATNNIWIRVADVKKAPSFELQYDTFGLPTIVLPIGEANTTGEWNVIDWNDPAGGGPLNKISFTAPTKGVYQVIFAANYGIGHAKKKHTGDPGYDFAVGKGIFRLQFKTNGVLTKTNMKEVSGFAVRGDDLLTSYYFLPNYTMVIENVALNAGDLCEITADFDEILLKNNDNAPDGESWIGYNVNTDYLTSINIKLVGQ